MANEIKFDIIYHITGSKDETLIIKDNKPYWFGLQDNNPYRLLHIPFKMYSRKSIIGTEEEYKTAAFIIELLGY